MTVFEIVNSEYSEEEKDRFKELIKIIVHLSERAFAQGILSLQDECPSLKPFLLRKAVELLVEGLDAEDLKCIISNYIGARYYSEPELLERLIIKEGVLLIQSGSRGRILFEKILSMLGEGFLNDFQYGFFDEGTLSQRHVERSAFIYEESTVFENEIMSITDSGSMEELLEIAGYVNMALALKVSSGRLNAHVFDKLISGNMSEKLKSEMTRIGPIRIKDGLEAQRSILMLYGE